MCKSLRYTLFMTKKVKLDGLEIAGFIKDRQSRTVRSLKQSSGVQPKLAVVRSLDNPAVDIYLKVKQRYADEIGVVMEIHESDAKTVEATIKSLNLDTSVHGIVLQLPFEGLSDIDKTIKQIAVEKDVDNLSGESLYDAPTATAILWLLAAYNVQLEGKCIVVVGQGRLVGGPLVRMLRASGIEPMIVDENTKKPEEIIMKADILISGVGKPELIQANMIKTGAIIIDAGVASDNGVLKGDVEDVARERDDISITPKIGGVGPLTVSALFDNVIRACI